MKRFSLTADEELEIGAIIQDVLNTPASKPLQLPGFESSSFLSEQRASGGKKQDALKTLGKWFKKILI